MAQLIVCIYKKVTKQVNCFKYLSYFVIYGNEKDSKKILNTAE
jgi:hypothetical protein